MFQKLEFEPVCRQTVIVISENGLHLVPCSRIAQTASQFECTVHITHEDTTVDAKNIFDLMTLNAGRGSTLEIEAHGAGSAELVEKLARLFETDFTEAES
jgi:phosphotransferase system HPr (HPr) family protein